MAFNPATLIAGPAIIQRGGETIFTEGDVKVSYEKEVKDKKISLYGNVAQKFLSAKATISFKPAGLYASLYAPFQAIAYGSRLFGDTDIPTVIWSVDGKKYTFARTAITSIPALNLGVEKDITGDVTITAIKGVSANWSSADGILVISTAALTEQTVDTAIFRDGPFTVLYDGEEAEAEEGVDVNLNLSTSDVKIDREGLVDMRVTGIEVTASFKPVSWTEARYKDELGLSGTRGGLITGKSLVISDPVDTIITLGGMVPRKGGSNFGAETSRQETMEFTGTRILQAGVPGNWFTIGFGSQSA